MYTKSNEKINYEDEIRDMSHDEFKDYCLKLSKDIDSYCKKNNVRIDYVVPILRSGAVPAVYIANQLNLHRFKLKRLDKMEYMIILYF